MIFEPFLYHWHHFLVKISATHIQDSMKMDYWTHLIDVSPPFKID